MDMVAYSGPSSFDSAVVVTSTASQAAEAVSRDRPFNPWRVPKTDAAKALVGDVINQLQHFEVHLKLRKRKRKAADQVTFEAAVGALVCDLVHRDLGEPGGWLSLALSKEVLQ